MKTVEIIFVVLVYRNTADLLDFFEHLNIPSVKVIIINSYFDDDTESEFKRIAEQYSADFMSVPNLGYGAGNNRGIEFALQNYDFKYLVISNADITIKNMTMELLDNRKDAIYAPSIRTLSGKQQNPHIPFHSSLMDRLKYIFFLQNNWNMIMFICALNKVFRILFLAITRHFNGGKIYSAHGSFVILPKSVLQKLAPLYDENVFLFTEEEHLAMKARKNNIPTYYVPSIDVLHKEDGSTSTISCRQKEITRESFITYYKRWYIDNL